MLTTILATILAAAAVTSNGVDFKPFTRGMDRAGTPVVTEYFIGLEWDCAAGGGKLRKSDEVCYAGLEYGFDDAAGLVTGP